MFLPLWARAAWRELIDSAWSAFSVGPGRLDHALNNLSLHQSVTPQAYLMDDDMPEDAVREFLVETIVAGQELTDRIAQLRSDGQDPMVYRPLTLLRVAAAHFHTLRSLVIGAEVSHSFVSFSSFVPFSVVRTALESAATVLWLLGPGDRTERIVRGLRLELTDREDFDRAVSHRNGARPATAIKEYRKEIRDLARQATSDRTFELTKVWTKQVLEYAAIETPNAGDVVGAWQMCSAFAHGRSWPASVVFPRTDGHPDGSTGDVSWVALAHVVGATRHVMARALDVFLLR